MKAQQQNVTLNRMGSYVSRKKSPNIDNLETIIIGSLPQKDKISSSGVMQKVRDKSIKRVRFPKNAKVCYTHCECNNMMLIDKSQFYCSHYEALLQLTQEEAIMVNVKGKKVMLENGHNALMPCKIIDWSCISNGVECMYIIHTNEGAILKHICTSKTRIVVLY